MALPGQRVRERTWVVLAILVPFISIYLDPFCPNGGFEVSFGAIANRYHGTSTALFIIFVVLAFMLNINSLASEFLREMEVGWSRYLPNYIQTPYLHLSTCGL